MATYFVSLTGNDANAGTELAPFRTFSKGVSMLASPGDVLMIRGGTWNNSRLYVANKFGASGNPIVVQNYPGEQVILDYNNIRIGSEWEGAVHIQGGNWVTIKGVDVGGQKGIQIKRANQRGGCIYTTGNNCGLYGLYAEYCFHSGLFIDYGTDCFIDYGYAYENAWDNNGTQVGNIIYTRADGKLTWSGGISCGSLSNNGIIRPRFRGCVSVRNRGEGLGFFGLPNGGLIEDCISYDNYSVNIYIDSVNTTTCQRNICYQTANSYLRTWGSPGNSGTPYLDGILTANEQAGKECRNISIINNFVPQGRIQVVAWASGGASTASTNMTCAHNTTNAVSVGPGPHTNLINANNYTGGITQAGGDINQFVYYTPSSPVSVARLSSVLTDAYGNLRSDPTIAGAIEGTPAPAYDPLPLPWTGADVNAGVAGSSGYKTGVYQVVGSGADVSAASDGFYFVSQAISFAAKNWELIARVTSVAAATTYSKTGLMVRSSTAANAQFAAIDINPSNRMESIYRLTNGGAAVNDAVITNASTWLRIKKDGTSILRSYSIDALPSSTDLALSKTATASSVESGSYPASNAVDGSDTTRWSSSFSDNQWLKVDLGSSQWVERVQIWWQDAYATSYQIQTSTDDTNWTTVYSTTTGTGGLVNLYPTLSKGRYVRVNCLLRATAYGFSIYTLNVYGQRDLALTKTATASSTESASFPASNAFDGNDTTRWSSAFGDPQWIQVDLGANYLVNRVNLLWEAAYASVFQIQTSLNGTTWTTVYSTAAGTGGANEITFAATEARYVRMYGTGRATAYGYSLYTFQVFGSPSWTNIAPDVTISFTGNTIQGLFVCSQNNATTATGLFDNVSFTDTDVVVPPQTGSWIFGIAV